MRLELPEIVLRQRVIPVARGQTPETAPALASALAAGGLSILEITVEADGGIEAIAALSDSPTLVAAGSVTSTEQAKAATKAGAAFLVSPHLDTELLEWARARGLLMIPGVLTPTEMNEAIDSGASVVKLFPASLGGPSLIKSILAPYPDVRLIPTGGVDDRNARSYLEAGAVAVGVGAWLTGHSDSGVVTNRARALVSAIG